MWGLSDLDLFRGRPPRSRNPRRSWRSSRAGFHRPYTIPKTTRDSRIKPSEAILKNYGFTGADEYNSPASPTTRSAGSSKSPGSSPGLTTPCSPFSAITT
ncbi:MAG: hypothetical protein ACLSTO_09780 [Bilophila wadsworthia]